MQIIVVRLFLYIEKLRLNVEADIIRPRGEPPSPIRADNLFCIIQTVYTREKNTREKNTREKTQEKKHKRKNTREKNGCVA
jgi:hypothetical protein